MHSMILALDHSRVEFHHVERITDLAPVDAKAGRNALVKLGAAALLARIPLPAADRDNVRIGSEAQLLAPDGEAREELKKHWRRSDDTNARLLSIQHVSKDSINVQGSLDEVASGLRQKHSDPRHDVGHPQVV